MILNFWDDVAEFGACAQPFGVAVQSKVPQSNSVTWSLRIMRNNLSSDRRTYGDET
jgi:hypothetical protein